MIEAAVQSVGSIREFVSKKSGHLCKVASFVVRDSEDSIKVTLWRDAIDAIDMIKVGSFVRIQGASIKPRNERYASGCTSRFELHLSEHEGKLTCIAENLLTESIATHRVICGNLTTLSQVNRDASMMGHIVSVVGAVGLVNGDPIILKSRRTGKRLLKTSCALFGPGCEGGVKVDFWNQSHHLARHLDRGSIALMQNVRVGEYQGVVRLSFNETSVLEVNPRMDGLAKVADWARDHLDDAILSISERRFEPKMVCPMVYLCGDGGDDVHACWCLCAMLCRACFRTCIWSMRRFALWRIWCIAATRERLSLARVLCC